MTRADPLDYHVVSFLCSGIALLFCMTSQLLQAEPRNNPHDPVTAKDRDQNQCLSCHKKQPINQQLMPGRYRLPELNEYVKKPTEMCIACHQDNRGGHVLGMASAHVIPADLPLDENDRMTCLTCHYYHGSLKSDKPMASTSLMDRLFNRERLNKSYLLRRNNAHGDLCLACHNE